MQQLLRWLTLGAAVAAALAQCPSQTSRLANLTAFPHYDAASRPFMGSGQPVNVSVQLYIAAISDVDQKTQKVDLEGYFRLEWMDPRLANDDGCGRIILQLPTPSVWQPDIYFDNSVREWYSAGSLIVYPDGRVWRSVRFHHLLRCPMEFHALPFDKQRCFLQMSSYSWDLDNINAGAFSNGAAILPEDYDGTTEWQIGNVESQVTTEWFGVGENRQGYKYVWVYLTLGRRPNAFMVFVFFTAFAFALVSWVGLFIKPEAAPARVAIAVIPVLIMLNLESSVTSQLPPLNYLTWMTSLLFTMKLFTMSCVFEYGLVAWLMRLEGQRDRKFQAMKQIATALQRDKEELRKQNTGISVEGTDVDSILAKGPAQIQEVYDMFDTDHSGSMSWREVQLGFRQLGQYLSKDQVHRVFLRLGIEGEVLEATDFKRLLMDLNEYLPGTPFKIHYWERAPSMQVDLAFRYVYIVLLFTVCLVWLATIGM